MPGGDRTGPAGAGPRTGRAMGYCGGNRQPGYLSPGPGMGRGRGGGGGRGWRNRFFATGRPGWMDYGGGAVVAPDAEERQTALAREVSSLRAQLEALSRQLTGLVGKDKTD